MLEICKTNSFSRVLKSVAWGVVELCQCCASFWIPSMYVFKWCEYEAHAPNSCWEICCQSKKSLIFFQTQGKILKGIFEAQFSNLLEILLNNLLHKICSNFSLNLIVWIQKCRKNSVIFSRNIFWFYQVKKTMKWSV